MAWFDGLPHSLTHRVIASYPSTCLPRTAASSLWTTARRAFSVHSQTAEIHDARRSKLRERSPGRHERAEHAATRYAAAQHDVMRDEWTRASPSPTSISHYGRRGQDATCKTHCDHTPPYGPPGGPGTGPPLSFRAKHDFPRGFWMPNAGWRHRWPSTWSSTWPSTWRATVASGQSEVGVRLQRYGYVQSSCTACSRFAAATMVVPYDPTKRSRRGCAEYSPRIGLTAPLFR